MVNEWLVTAIMAGVVLDFLIGDPSWLPHPVVGYGKIISSLEHKFNKGDDKQKLKNGAFVAIALILATFIISSVLLALVIKLCAPAGYLLITIGVFFWQVQHFCARLGECFKQSAAPRRRAVNR